MAKDRILTTIDIGSSKVVCLIADTSEQEGIQVIGVSSIPSRGVKKGVIVDIDQTVDVLAEALEAAERMAGVTVSRVWVTMNGNHISSLNSQGRVSIATSDGEIGPTDIERVLEAAKAISIPSSREIVHVIPRTFTVDNQDGIDDPVGMSGNTLQIETHIITAAATSVRNLVKSVQEVGLDVENLIFSGLASSESVLTDTEKELGVITVDVGGGTTNVCVYHEGAPVYSSVIKLGGKNITSDIAIGLRVPLEDAEVIKKFVGRKKPKIAMSDEREGEFEEQKSDENLDISELGLASIQSIDRKFLVEGVIKPRLEEIAEEIVQEIKRSGYEDLTPAGVVVCGGTALTAGLVPTFEEVLDLPVRIGEPSGVSGLIDEIRSPDYAASVGSVVYAVQTSDGGSVIGGLPRIPISLNIGSIKNLIVDFVKGLMP